MSKIEVDEADYKQSAALQQRFNAILADPKRRTRFLEAWQETNPDLVIPEVRAKEPIMEELGKLNKRLDDEAAARAKKDSEQEEARRLADFSASWNRQKTLIRQTYPDLNDKGVEEVEKLAKERGIPDLEAAAALFRQLNPPAEVGTPNGGIGSWGFFDQPQDNMKENMEKLIAAGGENEQVLNSMIRETLADVRGQRRAA